MSFEKDPCHFVQAGNVQHEPGSQTSRSGVLHLTSHCHLDKINQPECLNSCILPQGTGRLGLEPTCRVAKFHLSL